MNKYKLFNFSKYSIYNMKISFVVLVSLIYTISSYSLFSQDKLSLEEAIKIGLKNNYSIKISSLQKNISKNNLDVGTSVYYPSMDLQLSQNNTSNNVKQSFFDGREVEKNGATGNTLDGSITANWKLFDGFQMFIDYDILKLSDEVSKLNLRKKTEELTNQIINSYYQLYYLNENLELIKSNLEVSRFRYNILSQRKEIGKSSGYELQQAEIDLNKDIADSIDFYRNYKSQMSEFNLLLGLEVTRSFIISDTLNIEERNFNYSDLKDKLSNNIDIKLADLGIEISLQDIKKQQSNFYPNINIYGGYAYNASESQAGLLKSNITNGFNYGISLNMNIFEGFRNKILIENKEVESQISKINKEELQQTLNKELKFNIDAYNSNSQIKEFNKKNLILSQNNLEIAKEKLQLGTINQIEFREIQLSQIQAYNQLLLTNINLKIFETTIQRLLGMLII